MMAPPFSGGAGHRCRCNRATTRCCVETIRLGSCVCSPPLLRGGADLLLLLLRALTRPEAAFGAPLRFPVGLGPVLKAEARVPPSTERPVALAKRAPVDQRRGDLSE